MGRPQEIDPAALLEHARQLWVEQGQQAVTTRAVSARAGVSSGSLYSYFGSRDELIAKVWAAEATAFRAFQAERVDSARRAGDSTDVVLAAALATGDYAAVRGAAVRVLFASRPGDGAADLPTPLAAELARHRTETDALLAVLAYESWGRHDADAVALMRMCVVDVPARLLVAGGREHHLLARHAIEHAVRGILAAGPPG